MLPQVVTYWYDHVQVSSPRTSFLLGLTATQTPTLVTLRSHSKVLVHLQLLTFVAATRFYQCLIVDLALIDACVVRKYNTSQISQGVIHKSSKGHQNVARISHLYVDKLDWNPKHFYRLGPLLKFCRISFSAIFDQLSLIFWLIELGRFSTLFFAVGSNLKFETHIFEQCLTHKLDVFCSWFANTYKIEF